MNLKEAPRPDAADINLCMSPGCKKVFQRLLTPPGLWTSNVAAIVAAACADTASHTQPVRSMPRTRTSRKKALIAKKTVYETIETDRTKLFAWSSGGWKQLTRRRHKRRQTHTLKRSALNNRASTLPTSTQGYRAWRHLPVGIHRSGRVCQIRLSV